MKSKWIKTIRGNYVLKKRGYAISYNPDTNASGDGTGAVLNMLGAMLGYMDASGQPETALIHKEDFYILNGDFRKEYEGLKTFKECKKFFLSKPELKSSWSN